MLDPPAGRPPNKEGEGGGERLEMCLHLCSQIWTVPRVMYS